MKWKAADLPHCKSAQLSTVLSQSHQHQTGRNSHLSGRRFVWTALLSSQLNLGKSTFCQDLLLKLFLSLGKMLIGFLSFSKKMEWNIAWMSHSLLELTPAPSLNWEGMHGTHLSGNTSWVRLLFSKDTWLVFPIQQRLKLYRISHWQHSQDIFPFAHISKNVNDTPAILIWEAWHQMYISPGKKKLKKPPKTQPQQNVSPL